MYVKRLLAALLLFPSVAFAGDDDSTNGENACDDLGAECICAEAMNTAESATSGQVGHQTDFTSSDDTKECWRVNSTEVYSLFDTNGVHQMVGVSGWGSTTHAFRQTPGASVWANGRKVTNTDVIPADTQTICYRQYKQVDTNYMGVWDGCPSGTIRNKIIQTDMNNFQMQLEEANRAGCGPAGAPFPELELSFDTGPVTNRNVRFTPPITHGSCISAPCRIEVCIDSTTLMTTGQDVRVRSKIVPVSTGVEHTATSELIDYGGGPTRANLWGGDWFHSSTVGGSQQGFFMQAAYNTVADQWIGPASEVEGAAVPTLEVSVACTGSPSPAPLVGSVCTATAETVNTGVDYRFILDCDGDGEPEGDPIDVNDDATPGPAVFPATYCDGVFDNVGTYNVIATLEDYANAGAGVGTPADSDDGSTTVTVAPTASQCPADQGALGQVTNVQLWDAGNFGFDWQLDQFFQSGDTIPVANKNCVALRADVNGYMSSPPGTGSVKFEIDDELVQCQTGANGIFSHPTNTVGGTGIGGYQCSTAAGITTSGAHELVVTPYDGENCDGAVGNPYIVNFTTGS